MNAKDWILIALFLAMGAMGAYIMTAPRRLFTRAEDPARYRPEAVEYDSDQGRWLRTRMGPALIVVAIVLIAFRFL
jgi:cytochrome c oxidase assembly factor CtaG